MSAARGTKSGLTHADKRLAQRNARWGISAIFLINGFTLASWISRIPTISDKLDLSTGHVGTALMSLAAGAILAFPTTGRLIDPLGSARTILLLGLIMLGALPFVGLAPHLLILAPILFIFGAGNGAMDVSMNAQGVEVEQFFGGSIMNSLHGCFSVGAFAGGSRRGRGLLRSAPSRTLPDRLRYRTGCLLARARLALQIGITIRARGIADLRPAAPVDLAARRARDLHRSAKARWPTGAGSTCTTISTPARDSPHWDTRYFRSSC